MSTHECHDCDCVECRIRALIRDEAPLIDGTETFLVDTGEVLEALASIAGELLVIRDALTDRSDTELFIAMVHQARARWLTEDHVLAQRSVAGHC